MANSTPDDNSKPSRLAQGAASQSPLALWVEHHERQLGLAIKGRFRGNSLHLLCEFPYEADTYPSQAVVCRHFQKNAHYTLLNRLVPPGYPRIRHIWLYGRVHGAKKPAWTAPIHLNAVRKGTLSKPMGTLPEASPCEFSSDIAALQSSQPSAQPSLQSSPPSLSSQTVTSANDRAQKQKTTAEGPSTSFNKAAQSSSDFPAPALPQHVENAGDLYSRAEQGQPDAIAYYLRDVLVDLGVEASIRVKFQRNRTKSPKDRLWITCRGAYSPAAALVGEPIARQLRALSLHNVEDAFLQFQVRGEESPDWILRIDLTPQEDMLRSWAEWGDVEAISRLINQVLEPLNGQLLEATLKDITLHLSCTTLASSDSVVADAGASDVEGLDSTVELAESSDAPNSDRVIESSDLNDSAHRTGDDTTSTSQLSAEFPLDSRPEAVTSDPWTPNELGGDEDVSSTPVMLSSEASRKSEQFEGGDRPILNADGVRKALATLLTQLQPQGIQNVVVYGQQVNAVNPDWIEWIHVSQDLDRTASPLTLASNGDLDAIAFLIQRVLNTDLNAQLATGGRRVQILLKKCLLHVMCDAPICPEETDVVPEVERLLRSLQAPGIEGLRIYGRRAGQRRPRWAEAIDFVKQPQMVPDPAPQFAATDAYVTELIATPTEPIIRPDLTASDLWDRWTVFKTRCIQSMRRVVLSSQLVVPTADSPEIMLRSTPRTAKVRTALVWTAVGALALVQTDLGLHQLSKLNVKRTDILPRGQVAQSVVATPSPETGVSSAGGTEESAQDELLESLRFGPSAADQPGQSAVSTQGESRIFDASGFTTPAETSGIGDTDPTSVSSVEVSLPAEIDSPYPSFNSEQLDFKLALYYQRVLEVGPPDVLILGSSRALRGIDPIVLENSLEDLGYRDADVFNFGINGATAQVVELIVERILLPEQLPKLIVWADGARAFNSGRDDRTFNGILASEGYEQLLSGPLLPTTPSGSPSDGISLGLNSAAQPQGLARLRTIGTLSQSLADSYQNLDEDLSDTLANVSVSHPRRDRIKTVLQRGLTAWLPDANRGPVSDALAQDLNRETSDSDTPASNVLDNSGALALDNQAANRSESSASLTVDTSTSFRALENIDDNGFLPLQIRFDPTQYYQSYARVAGNYDRDYSNFRVEGVQGNALTTLLTASSTYNIPIVFVNMPLTEEYLDPFRLGYEQTFRQYMLNLALQQENFIFRDLGELWLDNTDHRGYFSDPSHLNQYGADEISRYISKDPMIPWDVTTR